MAFDAWAIEASSGAPAYSGQELRIGTVTPWCVGDGTGLGVRSGVRQSGGGTDLRVQAQASPNMTVKVSPGVAVIQGASSALQGAYTYALDAVTNLTIGAAHASLTRVDRIAVRIRDSTFDTSGARDSGLVVIAGTPGSGTPALPVDATYYTLALVTVVALDTAINTGDITDQRTNFAAAGGTIQCTSATRPASPTSGQRIWESDTALFLWWDGSNWVPDGKQRISQQILGGSTASVTFSSIPQYFTGLELMITGRSSAAVTMDNVLVRVNGDTGTNYTVVSWQVNQGGGLSGNVGYGTVTSTATAATVGDIYGASAADGRMAGSVRISLPHYTNSSWTKSIIGESAATISTGVFSATHRFNGWFVQNAITSVTALCNVGSFTVNTRLTLYGLP